MLLEHRHIGVTGTQAALELCGANGLAAHAQAFVPALVDPRVEALWRSLQV